MITYSTATSTEELHGILNLQQANLSQNISLEEAASQGFLTVSHSFEQLYKLNETEPHTIAKNGNEVVGFLLTMTSTAKNDIPILIPMFALFDTLNVNGKTVKEYNYMVVGQVCIDKNHRGKGILDGCYAHYKEVLSKKYDFAITEIAATNMRSLKAHERIGFKEIKRYISGEIEWIIVVWDWNSAK
ncbi:GNAT family N-acetyltransferase [bacterium]|nr:MAG: GNAT family N-acetyltransferase [bacterium]